MQSQAKQSAQEHILLTNKQQKKTTTYFQIYLKTGFFKMFTTDM